MRVCIITAVVEDERAEVGAAISSRGPECCTTFKLAKDLGAPWATQVLAYSAFHCSN